MHISFIVENKQTKIKKKNENPQRATTKDCREECTRLSFLSPKRRRSDYKGMKRGDLKRWRSQWLDRNEGGRGKQK